MVSIHFLEFVFRSISICLSVAIVVCFTSSRLSPILMCSVQGKVTIGTKNGWRATVSRRVREEGQVRWCTPPRLMFLFFHAMSLAGHRLVISFRGTATSQNARTDLKMGRRRFFLASHSGESRDPKACIRSSHGAHLGDPAHILMA